MRDCNDLLMTLKKSSIEAVEAAKPVNIAYGNVVSVSPLQINVEQKMTLGLNQLVLTRNVSDYQIEMTMSHFTENDAFMNGRHTHTDEHGISSEGNLNVAHKHAYKGRKIFTVHSGLVVGDRVLLLRMQGGQKYIVWDRLVKT